MQSVMLGGEADPSAFMTEVGPFPYEVFRLQEGGAAPRRASRDPLPQLLLPQVTVAAAYKKPCGSEHPSFLYKHTEQGALSKYLSLVKPLQQLPANGC